jgi:hypothetical protein
MDKRLRNFVRKLSPNSEDGYAFEIPGPHEGRHRTLQIHNPHDEEKSLIKISTIEIDPNGTIDLWEFLLESRHNFSRVELIEFNSISVERADGTRMRRHILETTSSEYKDAHCQIALEVAEKMLIRFLDELDRNKLTPRSKEL